MRPCSSRYRRRNVNILVILKRDSIQTSISSSSEQVGSADQPMRSRPIVQDVFLASHREPLVLTIGTYSELLVDILPTVRYKLQSRVANPPAGREPAHAGDHERSRISDLGKCSAN